MDTGPCGTGGPQCSEGEKVEVRKGSGPGGTTCSSPAQSSEGEKGWLQGEDMLMAEIEKAEDKRWLQGKDTAEDRDNLHNLAIQLDRRMARS
jgi:hypothetical protein